MAEFVMPALGADMIAGTLVEWRKAPGEHVERGDIIAEVETEKGVIEVEVFASGTVERLLVAPGTKVPVGTPLAIINEGRGSAEVPPKNMLETALSAPSPREPVAPSSEGRPRVSPLARRRARELGLDLASLRASSTDGAVHLEDVEREAPRSPSAPATETSAPADKEQAMRRAIAAAMSRSKREIPHYYLSTQLDLGPASSWLTAENRRRTVSERLLLGVLFLKAAALAARKAPELNAHFSGDRALPQDRVHLGVAISLRQGGLVAPAIHDADRLSLDALMRAFKDLVERARTGALRSSEMSDATLTVTSLGERGVETVFPVIIPPQVAMVGFGKVVERPWSVGGQVVSRNIVTVTLSADHRVSDGRRGGVYLGALEELLMAPEKL